jgi:hypothetical protein
MQRRTKVAQWAMAAILAAFGGYLAVSAYDDRSLGRNFRAVPEGASRDEVIALMGAPDRVRAGCRDLPTWMNRPSASTVCAEELEYDAKLKPAFWTVGFDEEGRAIAKYAYVSR